MKYKNASLLLLILILLSSNVNGITTELKLKKNKKKENKLNKNWNIRVNGGLTLNSGNTKSTIINFGSKFNLKLNPFEYNTNIDIYYGRSEGKEISNKGKWSNNLSKNTGKLINWYTSVFLEYDKTSNVDLRTNFGLGIQFVFSDLTNNKSKLSTSLNAEFLNTSIGFLETNSIRINFNYVLERNFSDTTKFYLNSVYTPNISNFLKDYRIEILASLSILMTKPIWLTLKIQDKYNNMPVSEDIKKNDLIFITSIEFSL